MERPTTTAQGIDRRIRSLELGAIWVLMGLLLLGDYLPSPWIEAGLGTCSALLAWRIVVRMVR